MSKISRFSKLCMDFLVAFFMKHLHPKSIRRLFLQIFSVFFSLFVLFFLITSMNYYKMLRNKLYASIKETLTLQSNNISQNFQEAMLYLSENCLSNSDISSLNTTEDKKEIYLSSIRIKKTLAVGNNTLSNIGGLFVYSELKDVFIPQANESWNNALNSKESNRQCAQKIQKLLREQYRDGTLGSLNTKSWFLLSDSSNNFLIRILKSRNTYAGAWTKLDYLSSAFESFQEMNAEILYVDQEGNCVGNAEFADVKISPQDSLQTPSSYYNQKTGQHYLAVSVNPDYCAYYITVLIPDAYFFKELSWLYRLMLFLLVWLLLLSLIMVSIMTFFFNTPSQILNPVIESLQKGKFDTKVQPSQDYQEIQDITNTFNSMIGEIQKLRIDIYEEQLAHKELELQYLKSQIAPHFLINCLNTIFVLSQEPTNIHITHAIIKILSDHLRYTLASCTEVSLKEEIYYVKNYLHLTQLRFPDTLQYDIQIEKRMEQAKVFPLILLMLTENSVKINVVMGEDFRIQIRGYLYKKMDQEYIHLTHIDSGVGFKQQDLELYNNITAHPEIQHNGKSIGLYNIATRLTYVFGGSGTIAFSNEPGMGARIDIDIPYIMICPANEPDIP